MILISLYVIMWFWCLCMLSCDFDVFVCYHVTLMSLYVIMWLWCLCMLSYDYDVFVCYHVILMLSVCYHVILMPLYVIMWFWCLNVCYHVILMSLYVIMWFWCLCMLSCDSDVCMLSCDSDVFVCYACICFSLQTYQYLIHVQVGWGTSQNLPQGSCNVCHIKAMKIYHTILESG